MTVFEQGNRHRRRAQRLIRRSERAVALGRWTQALAANEAAESAVRAAMAAGKLRQDVRVLGSLLYNRAMFLEQLGDVNQACHAARKALEVYHDIDPTWGSPKLVAVALAGGRVADSTAPELRDALTTADEQQRNRMLQALVTEHGMDREEVQEVIGQSADARTRYHRLAALTGAGRDDPALSDTNVAAPTETYRRLIAYGDRYTLADLARVEARYSEIRRLLDHPTAG